MQVQMPESPKDDSGLGLIGYSVILVIIGIIMSIGGGFFAFIGEL